jgi:hypothetical protein
MKAAVKDSLLYSMIVNIGDPPRPNRSFPARGIAHKIPKPQLP